LETHTGEQQGCLGSAWAGGWAEMAKNFFTENSWSRWFLDTGKLSH